MSSFDCREDDGLDLCLNSLFIFFFALRNSTALPYTGNALVARRGSSARRGSISSSPLKKRANSKDEGSSGSQELAASMKLLKSWDFDIYTHMHGESVDLAVSLMRNGRGVCAGVKHSIPPFPSPRCS